MWRPPDWEGLVEARIKEVNSKNPIVVSIKDNMEAGADAMLEALKGETYGKVPKGTTTIHLTFMTQKPYLFILIPDEEADDSKV